MIQQRLLLQPMLRGVLSMFRLVNGLPTHIFLIRHLVKAASGVMGMVYTPTPGNVSLIREFLTSAIICTVLRPGEIKSVLLAGR
ncbi:TPA: hypothetical protein MHZ87_26865 [Klebsiella pneumoniae subsp. pneumoniae]|nr:hypothetical protein [Klebsiella pneumoniae subsp. pneumoniae]